MKRNKNAYILKRQFSNFSIFDKLKDAQRNGVSANSNNVIKDGSSGGDDETVKRKPSKKVLQLVDDILNLTLIEAADLCELCQEKLEGNKHFNNNNFINRSPFPHPSNFFNAPNWNVPFPSNSFNNISGIQQTVPVGSISNGEQQKEGGEGGIQKKGQEQGENQGKVKNEEESKQKKVTKSTFGVKLEKYDSKNKINTIKEIRKITNVGLKEAKDMVESAPVYIQKGVPAEEANEIKKKFEALGATITLD